MTGPMKRLDRFDAAVVAVVAAALSTLAAWSLGPKRFGDDAFHLGARSLALALRGAGDLHDVLIHRALGPVLYYTIPYLFVPAGAVDTTCWAAAVAWNGLAMCVALLLCRRAAAALAGPRAGLAALVLALGTPHALYYSLGVLAETPAFLGTCVFVYGWIRERDGGPRWLMPAGLGLLVLSRPNIALVLPLALAAGLLMRRRRREAGQTLRAAAIAGLVVLASSATLAVVATGPKNDEQTDAMAHVAMLGRYQYRTEPWDWRFFDPSTREGSADFAAWRDHARELRREARETGTPLATLRWRWIARDLIEHPWINLRAAAIRLVTMHLSLASSRRPAGFPLGALGYAAFHAAVNLVNLLLVVGTLGFLRQRRGRLAELWPLWAPYLALVLFHLVVYVEPRYLFPVRPLTSIMTAGWLIELWRRRHVDGQPRGADLV